MTAEEGSSRESVYGFSCCSDASQATSKLLGVSDFNDSTKPLDSLAVLAFLEALERPEQIDRQDQKRRNTGTDNGNDYVFTHFDDPAKYMQRYRYYHTVADAGQCNTDPEALGIELNASYSEDSRSTKSIPSVASALSCTQDFRDLLLKSRLSVSEMSTATINRNKSAPCSQNLKSVKRVYLTWEQYVEMCESDAPSPQNQFHQTGSSLVSEETEQMTPAGGLRKVSSAIPLRKPCIDMNSLLSRKDEVASGSQISTGSEQSNKAKQIVYAKSEIGLIDPQKRNSRNTSNKSIDKSNSSFRTLGTLRKREPAKMCTEGGSTSTKCKQQTLPASHPEQSLSKISGEKITLKQQPAKNPAGQRCRNVRVSAVYRFTKGRRKQIHL